MQEMLELLDSRNRAHREGLQNLLAAVQRIADGIDEDEGETAATAKAELFEALDVGRRVLGQNGTPLKPGEPSVTMTVFVDEDGSFGFEVTPLADVDGEIDFLDSALDRARKEIRADAAGTILAVVVERDDQPGQEFVFPIRDEFGGLIDFATFYNQR